MVTLNDLERHNGLYDALCHHKILVDLGADYVKPVKARPLLSATRI